MAVPSFLRASIHHEIKTIEMHTTGEPTRIIYAGFPPLTGTLLEQRAAAKAHHDNVRKSVIHEPRGHHEMYGAALRPHTEHVDAGAAHMGALFLTHEGYSTMCGHATLALGRLLVDCCASIGDADPSADEETIFPKRGELQFFSTDASSAGNNIGAKGQVEVRLHVPCGIVRVTVPAVRTNTHGGFRADSDSSRLIHYLSVPSFAAGTSITVPIPPSLRWPALPQDQSSITADVAYGGAFYLFVTAAALGFPKSLEKPDMAALNEATRNVKAAFNAHEELPRRYLHHPDAADLQFLYSVFVTEPGRGVAAPVADGADTGVCFFADQQVDRSPTGSGVQARVALAVAKGERKMGQRWTYHSLLSGAAEGGKGGFVGMPVEEVGVGEKVGVTVEVSGWANYMGVATWVVEKGDEVGEGFDFEALGARSSKLDG
ncbi:proline racemase [Phyllosticta capitalensis]|uniref:trans-L-3-hydroxyproline dehydratase n=1 Tax=Phyllosticta capitalensis TaxID=121624 RepID=A0ABR1YPM7_9PEZI